MYPRGKPQLIFIADEMWTSTTINCIYKNSLNNAMKWNLRHKNRTSNNCTKKDSKTATIQNYWKNLTEYLKGTLMQIWKSPETYVCVHMKTILWKFLILNPKNSRVICLWSLKSFLKSRLIFILFFCFWMFVNKLFTYLTCAYPRK